MRTKLNKEEIKAIEAMQRRLCRLAEKVEENDVPLNYGNGTASTQLNCAIAALETILQEY